MKQAILVFGLFVVALQSAPVLAETSVLPPQGNEVFPPPPAGRRPPPLPPPEAFAACASKASGVACSVVTPHGEVLAGVCAVAPKGPPPRDGAAPAPQGKPSAAEAAATGALACRPERLPPPPAPK